jgi:hypothetical protein
MMIRKPSTFKKNRSEANIHSVICKGEDDEYKYFFKEQTQTPNISYLEYALAYGRINILKDILQDEFYINFLKKENYNPFDLSNCDIYLSTDVHDNSWWGNDEHERMVRNTPNDHSACFNLLETEYNKFMTLDNFEEWHSLTFYDIYYRCKYYPELKFLVSRILRQKDKDMSIKNVIEVFKNTMDNKPLLKIITKLFSADEIIPLLNF